MPALIIQSGSEAGRRLEVEGEHSIGREDQEFTLADPEVSRRHAVVRATATGVEIEDVGSSNGTFVNGERISGARELSEGDEVRLGQTTFSVEAPRAQATRISAAPPVDPGATVIRPSGETPGPTGGVPDAPGSRPQEEAPGPPDYAAPSPGAERPDPGGPPEEPAPSEPEPPGYQPPGPQEPVPGTPPPGDYQAPQPEEPAAGARPDFVGEAGAQPESRPQEGDPGGWGGSEQQQYSPTDQQPAYGGGEQDPVPYGGPQGQPYPGPQEQQGQGYGQAAEGGQGGYAPPGQGGWDTGGQQAYGGQAYGGEKKSKTWLWIVIAVVALAIIAALVFFVIKPFGGNDLDSAQVESAIEEDVASTGLDVSEVSCPSDIPKEEGAEVTCDISVNAEGGPSSVTYRQDGDGDLRFVRFQ